MKTDFSHSLRTSQTISSPFRQRESSPLRQPGAPTLQQANRATAIRPTNISRIDTMLANKGSQTLERVLDQYGGGVQPISSTDPFERLSALTKQANDLFDKDPSAITSVQKDKPLYTAIQRLSKAMAARLPGLPPEQGNVFRGYMELAARINPIEPKPILP